MGSRLKTAGKWTAAGAAVIACVATFEGVRTVAYKDVVGIPTVCFGETRGIKMGDKYTLDECKAMLGDALVDFEVDVRRCLARPDAVPPKVYVAYISLAYNIGARAFCNSTVARRANAGDYRGSCDAISRWDKAGGRVIKGLVNRRAEERKICLEGL